MRVLASAMIDVVNEPTVEKEGLFRVNVWGQPPHDQTRVYEIAAKTDTIAAQQGIERFVDEMQNLPAKGAD